jgi:hypothetical protein
MGRNEQVDTDTRISETARYRRAAEEGLHQLDWCVNFLYRMRKDRIAQVIEKNSSQIRREMNRADG